MHIETFDLVLPLTFTWSSNLYPQQFWSYCTYALLTTSFDLVKIPFSTRLEIFSLKSLAVPEILHVLHFDNVNTQFPLIQLNIFWECPENSNLIPLPFFRSCRYILLTTWKPIVQTDRSFYSNQEWLRRIILAIPEIMLMRCFDNLNKRSVFYLVPHPAQRFLKYST